MADKIRLTIVTPDGVAVDKAVNYINIPTPDGSVGILSNHAPMLCAIADGALKVRSDGEGEQYFAVTEGIAEVINNTVTLLLEKTHERPEAPGQ